MYNLMHEDIRGMLRILQEAKKRSGVLRARNMLTLDPPQTGCPI